MNCPQCGAATEVNEKRGPFRDRRCTNPSCGLDFTTREQFVRPSKYEVRPGQHGRLCARTRPPKARSPWVLLLSGRRRDRLPTAPARLAIRRATQVRVNKSRLFNKLRLEHDARFSAANMSGWRRVAPRLCGLFRARICRNSHLVDPATPRRRARPALAGTPCRPSGVLTYR